MKTDVKGGRSRPPRGSKTPQSGGVSVRVRECRRCGEPLTGKQRQWCSPKCRMAANRAEIEEQPANVEKSRPTTNPHSIIGRREPAFSLVPKHSGSKGAEAVDLMRRAGYTLDDWQIDVLEAALGLYKGSWAAPEVCLVAARQNGKSEVVAAAALWMAASGPKKLIIVSSHEVKTNEELFLRFRDIVQTPAFEEWAPRIYTANGRESITYSNGSRIKFIARSKHSGRGFSADAVFLDEAMVLSDASWSSLKPSLSAAKQPQLWLISSAPLPDSLVLRRFCLRGRAAKDKNLAYFEWSASVDAAPDSLEAIAAANPSLGGRIDMRTVLGELKSMDPEDFGRERLGWWREDETPSAIPLDLWDRLAFAGPLETTGTPVFGLDVTPSRDHTAIAAAALTGDGRPLVELTAMQKGSSWAVERLRDIQKEFPGAKVIVDRSAWAASLVDELVAAGIAVHEATTRDVTDAAGGFLDGVIEGTFLHRGDPFLRAAVESAARRPVQDRWAWDRRVKTANISPLISASLALWGIKAFKQAPVYFLFPSREPAQQLEPTGSYVEPNDPTGWVIKKGAVHPSEIGRLFNDG
jgi:Terminase large subunit, T4likevirus-type, N-terminal